MTEDGSPWRRLKAVILRLLEERPWLSAITIVIVVTGGIALSQELGSSGVGDDQPTSRDAVKQCERYVSLRLKAPSTAEFNLYAYVTDNGSWLARGTVDAENSFGAKIRDTVSCSMVYGSTGFTLVDLTGLEP